MRERSPGIRLLLVILVGFVLLVPLIMVYALVSDRQHQSRVAQDAITMGSGGPQVISGPIMVVPFVKNETTTEEVNGKSVTRTVEVTRELFLSPVKQAVTTKLEPEHKRKAIYKTVIYEAQMAGNARFEIPADLERYGVSRDQLQLQEAQIRFGVLDPRGLRAAANLTVNGNSVALTPGGGLAASGGAGFHGFVDWQAGEPIDARYSYTLLGSRSLTFIPRGGQTDWQVSSAWQHPGFEGSFLPDDRKIGESGFDAKWSIGNLALGEAMLSTEDLGPPAYDGGDSAEFMPPEARMDQAVSGNSKSAVIRLVEPVDVYSPVDRSVTYGFLFIGFTFLAYLMFDLIGGARVATAEYLLAGMGLVLFFVLLLAFAEVTSFAIAYIVASAAIIGLLTAYSAAILKSWQRARIIGALLAGLYALLYVLLSLEAFSLLIGSVLLFFALAGVMYATRKIDWSGVARRGDPAAVEAEPVAQA